MPKTLPDSLTFQCDTGRVTLSRTDDAWYEGECPFCLSTVAARSTAVQLHRDDTFSLKYAARCGGCEARFDVTRSYAVVPPESDEFDTEKEADEEWCED